MIGCSQRTLYNYIDQNLFSAINLDLPRKVRYKPRQKRRGDREVPGYRKGRTYADFELYMAQNTGLSRSGNGRCERSWRERWKRFSDTSVPELSAYAGIPAPC